MSFTKKLTVLLTVLFILTGAGLSAQENNEAEASGGSIEASTELVVQISTAPEIKVEATQSFVFPFLQGAGPLTEGNNLKTAFTVDFTPISHNGAVELTLTPVAFLQLMGGAKAGSGWTVNLFGGDIYGIGLNTRGDETVSTPVGTFHKSEVIGEAFDGLMWSAWAGGAFQFDFAALFPGDWNHVLFRTGHEAKYAAYTKAGAADSWFFESDDGENRNGWVYNSSYVLGYQMPLSPVLDTVAFMAEMKKNLYNTTGGDFWGDSLGYWVFSGLFNFTLTKSFSAALAVQMHTRRNHGLTDLENAGMLFYQDLPLLGNQGERRLVFYRTALILNYKLR